MEQLDDCFVTTQICEFVVQGGNGHNTLHLLCQCISTNWNHLLPDIGFWVIIWTQAEISRNVITLRTMANVLDNCSVRISLSTIRPPNLVATLSRPFCRSTVSSSHWRFFVCCTLYLMYYSVMVKSLLRTIFASLARGCTQRKKFPSS